MDDQKYQQKVKHFKTVALAIFGVSVVTSFGEMVIPVANNLDSSMQTMLTGNHSHDQGMQKKLDKATDMYNTAIKDGKDRSMKSILDESDHKVTATIFVGDLPAESDSQGKANNQLLKQFDQASIPHNWMFPNYISSNGAMRWDTSNNTDKNSQMYQDLDMPHFTNQKALVSHDNDTDSPTCNFAYEIVLWSHHQPIAVYQCTSDIGGADQHTKMNYSAALTILDNQIDPNTGKKITYQPGVALFLRNKGDQERFNHVSAYYGLSDQQPKVKFSPTDIDRL